MPMRPRSGRCLHRTPEVIVVEFLGRRRFEARHLAPLGIEPGHHVLDRPVLPGGVHRLEKGEQGVGVLRVELVLKLGEQPDAFLEEVAALLLAQFFRDLPIRLVVLGKLDLLAGRDDQIPVDLLQVEFGGHS